MEAQTYRAVVVCCSSDVGAVAFISAIKLANADVVSTLTLKTFVL